MKDMYPHQCHFKAVQEAVCHYALRLFDLNQEKIHPCLDILKFGMGNTIVTFLDKYYEYGVDPDPDRRGLTIGGFESAFLANLEVMYLFDNLHHLMEEHVQFIGTYHGDEIIVFRRQNSN
jgi:hypothetical protein